MVQFWTAARRKENHIQILWFVDKGSCVYRVFVLSMLSERKVRQSGGLVCGRDFHASLTDRPTKSKSWIVSTTKTTRLRLLQLKDRFRVMHTQRSIWRRVLQLQSSPFKFLPQTKLASYNYLFRIHFTAKLGKFELSHSLLIISRGQSAEGNLCPNP